MVRFNYVAEKNGTEPYKGFADVRDRFELYQLVRRDGAHIISVTEEGNTGFFSMQYWNLKFARISEYEKILFARNLGAMLSAGLPLSRALSVIERQTRNPKFGNVVSALASDVRRGDAMHVAVSKFPDVFSKIFIAMIRAGEEGGDLPQSLTVVSEQMERMYDLKKKIHGALIYPSIVLVAIVGIGMLMMIEVVPTLAQTFADMKAQLPLPTQIVIGMSKFLVQYTVLAVGGIVAFVALIYLGVKTRRGARVTDFLFLHLPIVGGLVREINAARTARALASLLSSGVDVVTSLDITAEVVQNSYFKEVILAAADGVRAGETLSTEFVRREDLYPAFVGEMMSVGEETGATNEMLKRLAIFFEDEVDRKTKDMSIIIEPFLMLFIGAAVGFFAISMISPIYQLSEHI